VRAGESFGAWLERVRRVAVIDPELADSERRRMAAQDQQRREAASQSGQRAAVALRWLLGSLTALVVTALRSSGAVTDLRQQVASTRPASIEITIDGWHRAVEPGDDPDTLGCSEISRAMRRNPSRGPEPAGLALTLPEWDLEPP
jgi:hypothetical protein